jgi:hypothetical protein
MLSICQLMMLSILVMAFSLNFCVIQEINGSEGQNAYRKMELKNKK